MNPAALADRELERVTAGKDALASTLKQADEAFQAHAQAARSLDRTAATLEAKGGELLDSAARFLKGGTP